MATRTYTVTREECATLETLQALQNAEREVAGVECALKIAGDKLTDAARANVEHLRDELAAKVQVAQTAHDAALATWNAIGAPTYRGRGTPMRWNRA